MAVVSMKKQYPGHAKRVMMGVWSFLRQFMYTKFVIVVDDDVDTRNWEDVIWAITTRMDPARDTTMIENTPIDYLDFASPVSGLGSKMGMDATNKMPVYVAVAGRNGDTCDDGLLQEVHYLICLVAVGGNMELNFPRLCACEGAGSRSDGVR